MGKQIYYKHQYSDELLDGGKNRIAGITPSASGAFEAMHPRGKEVAASMYHVEGFCCHHNTDIWGIVHHRIIIPALRYGRWAELAVSAYI